MDMALRNFEAEVKLLKNKSRRPEGNFTRIDEEMAEIIKRKSEGVVQDELLKASEDDCKREELKSLRIWQKSKTWLEVYAERFGSDIIIEEKADNEGTGQGKRAYPENGSENSPITIVDQGISFGEQQKQNPPRRKGNHNNANNTRRNGNPKSDRRNTSLSMQLTRDGITSIGNNVQNSFLGQSRSDNEGGGGGEERNGDRTKCKPQTV